MAKVRVNKAPVMNTGKKVKVKAVPNNQLIDSVRENQNPMMAYGGPLPGTGTQAAGNYAKLDTTWDYYKLPYDRQGYKPDAYQTGNALPSVPRQDADIVIEKKENILGDFTGDGQATLMQGNSGSHASGNDQPVNVPDNSFVFSDTKALKLKGPEVLKTFGLTPNKKGYTPAEIAKKYDLQKYKAIMDDPDKDTIAKRTAQIMYNNYLMKLQTLAAVQEDMKKQKGLDNAPQQEQAPIEQEQQPMMSRYGGAPQYQNAGVTPPYTKGYTPNANIARSQVHNPTTGQTDFVPDTTGQDDGSGYNPEDYTVTASRVYPKAAPPLPLKMMDVPQYPLAGGDNSISPANMSDFTAGNTLGTFTTPSGSASTDDGGQGKGKKKNFFDRLRDSGIGQGDPNAAGDLAFAMKAAMLKKRGPWEPAAQHAVMPRVAYESDQPIRNALTEQSNIIRQGMYAGDERAARASALAGQGELLGKAVGAVGEVANRNAQIYNAAEQQATALANQELAMERERLKNLYQGNVISDQQYENSVNALANEWAKRKALHIDALTKQQNINLTSPYYQSDLAGRLSLKPGVKQEQIDKVARMNAGQYTPEEGIGRHKALYDSFINTYKDKGIKNLEEQALNYADTNMGYKRRTSTTKQGSNTIKESESEPIEYGGRVMRYGGAPTYSIGGDFMPEMPTGPQF